MRSEQVLQHSNRLSAGWGDFLGWLEAVGSRTILVLAISSSARRFYFEGYGFAASPNRRS